jgi:hypothetical protein
VNALAVPLTDDPAFDGDTTSQASTSHAAAATLGGLPPAPPNVETDEVVETTEVFGTNAIAPAATRKTSTISDVGVLAGESTAGEGGDDDNGSDSNSDDFFEV